MKKPAPKPAAEVPLEYALPQPDRRAPLLSGGEVGGVFANPQLAEQTRRFLAGLPKRPGGAR